MTRPRPTTLALLLVAVVGVVCGLAEVVRHGHTKWQNGSTGQHGSNPAERAGFSDSDSPRSGVTSRDDNYVGSAVCARCHAEISETYAAHPMAQSAASVAEATPIENYAAGEVIAPPGPRRYRVERRGDRVFHHEIMLGAGRDSGEGEVLYDQAEEVQLVLGSGARGRAYVLKMDGLLFASPLTWYSTSSRWDLAPGYAPDNHPRFERPVRQECLYCHVGRTASVPASRPQNADVAILEAKIGCERCHGPGGAHVERRTQNPAFDGPDSTIVNPARLDSRQRDSVCNQCHLHGEFRMTRTARKLDDFRPGQMLDDVWCVFVASRPPESHGLPRAVSQVEQMRVSRCFQGSDGQLGCISCHDPHAVPSESRRAAHFQKKCLACHAEGDCSSPVMKRDHDRTEASCIQCHMPRVESGGVPHTAQTDHRILRDPETVPADRADWSVLELFDGGTERIPEFEQQRARGIMLLQSPERGTRPLAVAAEAEQLLRASLSVQPDDPDSLHYLGLACLRQSRHKEALFCWQQVLRQHPDHEATLQLYAELCQALGNLPEASAALERLLQLNPWQAEFQGRYAVVLSRQGEWLKAIGAAEKGLQVDPSFEEIRKWLAAAYQRVGRIEEGRGQADLLEKMRAASRPSSDP